MSDMETNTTPQDHRTRERALAYLEGLIPRAFGIESYKVDSQFGDSRRLLLRIAGMPNDELNLYHIVISAGKARDRFYRHDDRERVTQISITASRAKKSDRGYWGDAVRVFKLRKDGTINGDGVLKALKEIVLQVLEARQQRLAREKQEDEADAKKREIAEQLRVAGLDMQHAHAYCILPGGGSASVTAQSNGVKIEISSISVEQALALLRAAGVIK